MIGGRDPLLDRGGLRRRRRRFPRPLLLLAVLGGAAGVVALWASVFGSVFIEPEEWHARQRRFDRAIREVLMPPSGQPGSAPELPAWPPRLSDERARVVACAEAQVARGVRFATTYPAVSYPWGDVPDHQGTSADLIVRCLRAAGLDLQQLIQIDRKAHAANYPLHLWAQRAANRSIDHRRMPNLFAFAQAYFEPASVELDTVEAAAAFLPGDIVFWAEGGPRGFPGHAGVVIDRRGPDGIPWAVTLHPADKEARLHHRVDDWTLQARFVLDGDRILQRFLEANPGAVLEPRPAP